MKLRHLPPVLFLFVTALSLPSLSFHRHLSHPRSPPSLSSHHAAVDDDALLRRLASVDPGADYLLAEATELLANASLSSTPSPGNHRLLTLRFPSHSTNATAYRLRVPHDSTLHADDATLLTSFRASLRSVLLTRRRHIPRDSATIAAVVRDLPALLGLRRRRFPTCAVVGNSGILLGSGRGAQIDAHDFIIRLNNAPAGGEFTRDVGARTSLSLAHSTVLRRCATSPSAATTPRCSACHPYGRDVPFAIYVSHAAHLLDALVCGNATATPFRLVVTDPRLDALCARIAKYYSLRRFVAETGSPASGWRRDERPPHFHYSSGLQAVVVALGVCDEVSMFGFGKAAGTKHHYHTGRKKETAVHDYEAEYQFYRDLRERPEMVPFLDQAVAAGFKTPPVRQYW
ncbi:unnamed protein product [Urochloa decumbens]|uniref:Uncharacterized protein n=1 Tax=Urochloa decumbens TaxID=240449 RepID=A0ABC9B8M4_9POAL